MIINFVLIPLLKHPVVWKQRLTEAMWQEDAAVYTSTEIYAHLGSNRLRRRQEAAFGAKLTGFGYES